MRVPATLALLWRRPAFVPLRAVLVAMAAQGIGWASSGLIQIPMQITLTERGYSGDLFARLIVTDFWLRCLPFACELAVGALILGRMALALVDPTPQL